MVSSIFYTLLVLTLLLVFGRGSEYVWRQMTEKEMHGFYSPSDLCLLEKGSNISDYSELKSLKAGECNGKSALIEEGDGVLSIGYGIGSFLSTKPLTEKLCTPLVHRRSTYLKVLEGFSDPMDTSILTSISRLQQMGFSLLFTGDSISRQSFYAFLAEVKRQSHAHGTEFSVFPPSKIGSDTWRVMPSLAKKKYRDYYKVNPVGIHFGEHNFTEEKNVKVGKKEKKQLIFDAYFVWLSNPAKSEFLVSFLSELRAIGKRGVIIVANFGLHLLTYPGSVHKFTRGVRALFEDFRNVSGPNGVGKMRGESFQLRVLWRETTSSHFTGNGSYVAGIASCMPFNRSKAVSPFWQNKIVAEVARSAPFRSFVDVLPFTEVTVPLYDFHITHSAADSLRYLGMNMTAKADCTHFCWSPALWQPLWHAIRNKTRSILI